VAAPGLICPAWLRITIGLMVAMKKKKTLRDVRVKKTLVE
jgi:hypothetical protein